jgi:hypothetical protein
MTPELHSHHAHNLAPGGMSAAVIFDVVHGAEGARCRWQLIPSYLPYPADARTEDTGHERKSCWHTHH